MTIKAKILLVEDNDEMRENIAEILELADYQVHQAGDGKKGVELAKFNTPDMIICDIMMPGLDGYGVINILSEIEETKDIPFIFLTAKAEKEEFRKGMNLGADDYLTKPFEDIELLHAVEMRLKKHTRRTIDPEEELGFRKSAEKVVAEWKEKYPINKYKAKQVIFNEGNYARELMLITKGKVKLFKVNADGKEYIVELTSEGDFLGYNSIISSKPLSESACALDDSEICFIPSHVFKDLILKNKELGKSFLKILSKDIIEKEEKLLKLAYSSVRQRSADALLLLQKRYGEDNEEPFELYISRDDLAAIVGTATESLIRTLSDFKEEGLVEIKGGLIRILNEDGLKSLAV